MDGDSESTEPLKRFTPGVLYADPGTEVVIMPGQQKELAPGIYATKSESGEVPVRAVGSSIKGTDYDIVLSRSGGDGKDEWPQIMAMSSQLEAQGVSSNTQLNSFFGELSAGG
ncbi:MAG TPA: hypothetical protein VNO30_43200 [Kofleriaceae bacterium]|nr:hypothetical protein [Kofleriaceae bacterium]